MRKILVLFPGSSYEETYEAETIVDLKRRFRDEDGRSAPKGTKFRYESQSYFSVLKESKPKKSKRLTNEDKDFLKRNYVGVFK